MKIRTLHDYKYQTLEPIGLMTGICPSEDIDTDFIALFQSGNLVIKKGYAYDGASGPCPDFKWILRGALVHDALYQLMREGLLDKKWRNHADLTLKSLCIQQGMKSVKNKWLVNKLSNIIYWAVHRHAGKYAEPNGKQEIIEI